jgi:hypothetical protein
VVFGETHQRSNTYTHQPSEGGKMFKKILIVLMIGCLLLGMATRAEAENAVKSTTTTGSSVESEYNVKYIPKVIIEAKWGNGPGEFGIEPDPDVPSDALGPCGLTIDNEKLYILDAVNRRINVYSIEGSFNRAIVLKGKKLKSLFFNPGYTALQRDREGNFYILGYWEKAGQEINKFDSAGNFVKVIFQSPLNKEGYRINFGPYMKLRGDSLILRASEEPASRSTKLFYIHKDEKKTIIKDEGEKIRGEKWVSYYLDYPKDIKEGRGLTEDMRNFVFSCRDYAQVVGAKGYDAKGNFYELLWSALEYSDKGIKVIKWEKVK